MTQRTSSRRAWLHRSGALVLALSGRQLAWGATIVAVRVWPAADYTRVTIESDQALAAKHFMTSNPPRLVIDIDQLELSPTLRELVGKVRPDDPYIAGVRVGQNQPRLVRLVVDLKQQVLPQQFTLDPVAAYGNRLVFDLYPLHERDPLLELVREKDRADRRAEQAVRDSLGELIGRIERAPVVGASAPETVARGPAASASAPSAPSAGPPVAPPPPSARARREVERLTIVAIDPGHGGEDPGAIGPTGLREKDVVLAVALRLRERLNALPGLRAMLTRDADFFVPLHDRVRKARRVQADLFVSIHADAFITSRARGASVFALSSGGATSAAARWIADKENRADLVGGVNQHAVKDAQVLRAMVEMSTAAQIKDSLRVGGEILQHIGRVGHLHKGRVEQAGFAVLKAPDIPSVLVETAFISNPEEERLLRSAKYQNKLVDALVTAMRRYFTKHPPRARQRVL
ncbi:MAG: AMIN domain-containing protein [Burkholderiaceae bacterium]|nr:MAG: AMIN domain-containing protein [Burkholderiaceae bacterium]